MDSAQRESYIQGLVEAPTEGEEFTQKEKDELKALLYNEAFVKALRWIVAYERQQLHAIFNVHGVASDPRIAEDVVRTQGRFSGVAAVIEHLTEITMREEETEDAPDEA